MIRAPRTRHERIQVRRGQALTVAEFLAGHRDIQRPTFHDDNPMSFPIDRGTRRVPEAPHLEDLDRTWRMRP